MRQAMAVAELKEPAPAYLRARIEAALPAPPARAPAAVAPGRNPSALQSPVLCRRFRAGHRALGRDRGDAGARGAARRPAAKDHRRGRVGASALAAARPSDRCRNQRPAHGEAVVQRQARRGAAGHRPDRAGLYAIGGRLDDINGETVAAIVYRRRNHVINLFVAQSLGAKQQDTGSRDAAWIQCPALAGGRPRLLGRQRHRCRRIGRVLPGNSDLHCNPLPRVHDWSLLPLPAKPSPQATAINAPPGMDD